MCELCGLDPKKRRDHCEHMIEKLHRLAALYAQIGSGQLKPHTDDMKPVEGCATAIIRELVAEWL